MRPLILFITRNYPPKIGGIEIYSYHLIREFEKRSTVFKITLSRPNSHLFWFLPYCLLKALWLCRRHSIRRIHLCDGLLAPIGLILKQITGTQVTASVHGLDVTYPRAVYQLVVPRCLARLDLLVCVSRHTLSECLNRGIPAHKCRVVPNGIDPAESNRVSASPCGLREIEIQTGLRLRGRRILLTVGRMVPRKGIAWFVSEVMPLLDRDYRYLIAGGGPEFETVRKVVHRHGLVDRVALLGRVSDGTRLQLMAAADLLIMPNVRIPGDMEGFGITALEAGSSGLPVIASDLEGLKDAVIDGVTGHLVEERNIRRFIEAIGSAPFDREAVRSVVNHQFNWPLIAARYHSVLFARSEILNTQEPAGSPPVFKIRE